jgi:hypothetical protein
MMPRFAAVPARKSVEIEDAFDGYIITRYVLHLFVRSAQ